MNLVTSVTGIAHEKLQVFHRWSACALFVLALVHTFPFIVYHQSLGDLLTQWRTSVFYWTGVVALVAQFYLTAFSWAPIRNRFYEFFKATHMIAALVFVVFLFLHCDFRLTSWDYLIATGVLYALTFLGSYLRTFSEHGLRTASITTLGNGHLRISIPSRTSHMASEWTPGQHVFLRFLMFPHLLSAHPFTVCSLEDAEEMVFFVKPQRGLTARLASLAQKRPAYTCKVLLDGPYGGLHNEQRSLCEYDKNIIVAGGSGAGFALPLIEDVLQRRLSHRCNTMLNIIVSTRELETQDWFVAEVRSLFSRYRAFASEKMPTVTIHLTSGAARLAPVVSEETGIPLDPEKDVIHRSKEMSDSGSSDGDCHQAHEEDMPSFELRRGRCELRAVVKSEVGKSTGSLGVAVCGPASMLYDVRNAVADVQMDILRGQSSCDEVYLHTEHFGL